MLFRKNKSEQRKKLGHILAAFVILVHAYEKFELHESSYIYFVIAGLVFLAVALVHHRLLDIFPYADGVFFFIEAIVYALIALDFFEHGKKALPLAYLLVVILYMIVAFRKGKKGSKSHKQHTAGDG